MRELLWITTKMAQVQSNSLTEIPIRDNIIREDFKEKGFMFGQMKIIMTANSMKVANMEEVFGNLQLGNIMKDTTKMTKRTAVENIFGTMAAFTKDNLKTTPSKYLIT
jgi:hypothetical protein